jgi:hypothetical protein
MKKVSPAVRYPPLVITLLIVILLGSYLFIYIPRKEHDLQREHFRWLQQVDNNIQLKIEAADTLLSHLLEVYSNDSDRGSVVTYIDSFPKENFILFDSTYKVDKKSKNQAESQGWQVYDDTTAHVGTLYTMQVYDPLQTFIVSASKTNGDHKNIYVVSMQYTFKKFVEPLLNKAIFNHYVIFNKGHVVYEDFPSGLSYNKEDSLILGNKGVRGASIIDEKVGGEDYKMFLQPVAFGKNTWILAGLLSTEKYDTQRRELPWGFVLFLAVIALGLFLFIPLIRLFNLGNNDRLRIIDTVELVFVVNLLMSLLFFCFLRLYEAKKIKDLNSQITDSKSQDTLSKKISTAFTTEIGTCYEYLCSFDSLASYNHELQTNLSQLGQNELGVGSIFTESRQERSRKTKAVERFQKEKDSLKVLSSKLLKPDLNWYTDDGSVKFNWTYYTYNNPPANYGSRDYFKMIKNERPFLFSNDTFYVDQVISRVDGSFRTIISKKTGIAAVVALAFDLKSLDSVIMPAGYLFSLIKDDGTVLYHSMKNRSLNENLREEFSNVQEFDEALQGRYTETFSTSYYEKNYSVTVRPLKGFPYFIVILSDKDYLSSTDVETTSFTSAMMALFMLFIFVDIAFLVVTSWRISYFDNRGFTKTWLWPRESFHREYDITSLGNVFAIFLLAIYSKESYLNYFFILILSVPINTLFVNGLFALKYYETNKTDKIYRNYKWRPIISFAAFIIIINVLLIIFLANYASILLFEAISFAGYTILVCAYKLAKIFIKSWPPVRKGHFIDSYSRMIFTRVIFTSGIPVMFFYISSYNYEENLLARYRAYNFANELIGRFPQLELKKDCGYVNSIKKYKSVYPDGIRIKDYNVVSEEASKKDSLNRDDRDDSIAAQLFNLFSLYNQGLPANNDNFYLSHAADNSYTYNDLFKDVLYRNHNDSMHTRLRSGNYLQVESKNLNYPFPKLTSFSGFSFWALLLLPLAGFYLLVLYLIKRVFAVEVPDLSKWNKLDEKLLLNVLPSKIVFAVGLPGEDKLNYVQNILRKGQGGSILVKDLKQILENCEKKQSDVNWVISLTRVIKKQWSQLKYEMQKDDFKYIVVDNFEYKMSNLDIGNKKLDLIQGFISNNKKVTILSAVHPASYIDVILKEANQAKDDKEWTTNPDEYISRWSALLGDAPVVYVPVKLVEEKPQPGFSASPVDSADLINKMKLPLTNPINNLRDPEINFFNKELEKDVFSIKLQSVTYNYYSSIWHSLTLDEKLILYDLAEDGLVNTHNTFAFNSLSSKGLIVRTNGLLRIFSNSFRNFILTSIGDYEKTRLKKQFEENGTWSRLKTPLVFVIMAILVFIAISQQAVFTKAIGYVSLFAGSIPALIQLLSLKINRPNSKSLKG